MTALERFLRYVEIDTSSDKAVKEKPTSKGQIELLRLLEKELKEIGLNAKYFDAGYVTAKIPANVKGKKKVAFLAHVDTVKVENNGKVNARKVVFDGQSIKYDNGLEINLTTNPELKGREGEEFIVSDGKTILGKDDKAGIAEIMTMAEYFVNNPEVPHGDVMIAFTTDEEISRGVEGFDVENFGADVGYTLDGGTIGEVEYHNFHGGNAIINIEGVPAHTGYAKNIMINAINVLGDFMANFPESERPATTEGFEGFYHFYKVEGSMSTALAEIMIRDFFDDKYQEKKNFVLDCVAKINAKYGKEVVKCRFEDKIRNMYEVVKEHMYIVEIARKAYEKHGIKPIENPVRGGTDGARLSFMGLPCPNLSTGGNNAHSNIEYLSVKELNLMVEVIIDIVKLYAEMN
jgi:tripeptide aminopeptidase